jgi:hypothetical protein
MATDFYIMIDLITEHILNLCFVLINIKRITHGNKIMDHKMCIKQLLRERTMIFGFVSFYPDFKFFQGQ